MREFIGIVLCVQAVGGGISAALDGSASWFLQRHLLPESLQIPASVVMLAVALALLWSGHARSR